MNTVNTMLTTLRSQDSTTPIVSIYLKKPNSRTSQKVASIELYRQLSYARRLLERSTSRQRAAEYVSPLLKVAKDELISDAPGTLALFQAGETSICARLNGSYPEKTVVAPRPHIRPLLKSAQRGENPSAFFGSALTGLSEIARAMKQKIVRTLWVAEDATIWGVLNRESGMIALHPRQRDHRDGDLLDDLTEWALDDGIRILVLPRYQMPGQSPVAAQLWRKFEIE